jgi:hypothetical protein
VVLTQPQALVVQALAVMVVQEIQHLRQVQARSTLVQAAVAQVDLKQHCQAVMVVRAL